tara:strand:- start:3255 stop:3506 length:252 start_codon:yes stop_codon:yes gene_type:complete
MTKKTKRTLHSIIAALPTEDVQNTDLKQLILQLIMETPNDEGAYAVRGKLKLEALRLLSDIIRNDDSGSYEQNILDILTRNDE